MPFTLSHPAAVLPLRNFARGAFPLTALVAGSVSPDIPYYFTPFNIPYVTGNAHTIARTFTYCLPVGLTLLALLRLLEPVLRALLPEGPGALLRSGLGRPILTPRALPLSCVAVVLGALTHIAWDSFTHHDGFMVELLPFLQLETYFGFELFRVLQHLSTAFGLAVLYLYLRRECATLGRPLEWRQSRKWIALAAAAAAALAFTALTYTTDWNYALTSNDRRLGFLFLISFLRNFAVAAVLAAGALRLFWNVPQREG